MTGWKGMAWTLGLVFLVAALSKWLELGGTIGLETAAWALIFDAALAAVAAFVINFVTPWITRYGIGAGKDS